MIKLYLLDTENVDSLSFKKWEKELFALSPSVLKKIEATKDEKLKKDRSISYLFLESIIEKEKIKLCRISGKRYFSDNFKLEILFDSFGRPYIKDIDIDISLSHTEGLTAIAISFEKAKKVGIDAELMTEKSEERASKFHDRYLKKESINRENPSNINDKELLIELYTLKEGEILKAAPEDIFCDINTEEKNNDEKAAEPEEMRFPALSDWCALEALLKCDGGGFSSISRIKDIMEKYGYIFFAEKIRKRTYMIALAADKK